MDMSTIGKIIFSLIVIATAYALPPTPTASADMLIPVTVSTTTGNVTCDQPPYDGVTTFTQYKIYYSSLSNEILDSNMSGNGACTGSINASTLYGGNFASSSYSWTGSGWGGAGIYFLKLYSPDDSTVYGYMAFNCPEHGVCTSNQNAVIDSIECPTCTRIYNRNPDIGETVASTTQTYSLSYYINEDDLYPLTDTFLEVRIKRPLSNEHIALDTLEILTAGTGTQYWSVPAMSATGTYYVSIQLYREYAYFLEQDIIPYETYRFYVDTPNTTAELEAYASTSLAEQLENIHYIDNNGDYIGTTDNPSLFALLLKGSIEQFLRLPPWGYIYVFNDTMLNPTTTDLASFSITHTIPTGFPGEGKTLTLNALEGASSSVALIRNTVVTTIDGDPMEKFLTYWNTVWYIVFAIWLVRATVGAFSGISLVSETVYEKPESYQKSGGVRGVARVNAQRDGRTYMKRSQFKRK